MLMIKLFFVFAAAIIGSWYVVFFLYLRPFRCNVPGPLPLPIVGNWIQLLCPRRATLEPNGFQKIECYWLGVLGMKPYVFVCDPDIVKEIAIDKADDLLDRGTRTLVGFMAGASLQSILTSRGQLWRRQRDAMTPVLSSTSFADKFFDRMQFAEPDLAEQLSTPASTSDVSRCPFHRLTRRNSTETEMPAQSGVNVSELLLDHLTVVGAECVFGFANSDIQKRHYRHGEECARRDRAWSFWTILSTLPGLPTSCWRALSSLPFVRSFTNQRQIDSMHEDQVAFVREMLSSDAVERAPSPLLQSVKQLHKVDLANHVDAKIANSRMESNLVAMMNGSTKNEAAMVAFGLKQLAENPEIQQRLYSEIKDRVGDQTIRSRQQLFSMAYLDAVTKEIFRLLPGFPVLSKIAERNTQLAGFQVGRGVEVAVRVRSLQMHPEHWEFPESFYPEHHFDAANRSKYVYLPFGIGRRQCPGKQTARVGVSLALCQILQRFEVFPVANHPAPTPITSLAIGFRGSTRLSFVPRGNRVSVGTAEETLASC